MPKRRQGSDEEDAISIKSESDASEPESAGPLARELGGLEMWPSRDMLPTKKRRSVVKLSKAKAKASKSKAEPSSSPSRVNRSPAPPVTPEPAVKKRRGRPPKEQVRESTKTSADEAIDELLAFGSLKDALKAAGLSDPKDLLQLRKGELNKLLLHPRVKPHISPIIDILIAERIVPKLRS